MNGLVFSLNAFKMKKLLIM